MNLEKMGFREINFQDVDGVRLGHAQNEEAKTGVSVLIFDSEKAIAGVDISGGGPASRETPLLDPKMNCDKVNAIVLSGGSAFGLDAGGGVMRYLEEHGMGFPTGYAMVPIVCQSCIYDLGIGSSDIRPDGKMGYAACVDAEKNESRGGSIGAGCGATVGKVRGMERAEKAGLGIYGVELDGFQMIAVVVVNALGDIFDGDTGEKLAGMRSADGNTFDDSETALIELMQPRSVFTGNTTIGAIITNGKFSKGDMNKIASMTRSAYSRCIRPVGTMADGDSIYAVSVGDVKADINMAGTLAAKVMAEAIKRAVEK